jgi:hypothetical protein
VEKWEKDEKEEEKAEIQGKSICKEWIDEENNDDEEAKEQKLDGKEEEKEEKERWWHRKHPLPYHAYKGKAEKNAEYCYAWTALIQITAAASWLHILCEAGHGRNIRIDHDKGILFRSDVVHAGGCIEVYMQ